MHAQEENLSNDSEVIVVLKGGTTIEGEIVSWNYGDDLILKTKWNPSMVIPADRIKKVTEKSAVASIFKNYNYKETGLYYAAQISLIAANNGDRANNTNGISYSISAGKKFSRLLSVGAGIGYDNYIWDTSENFIPIFAEVSGYFQPTNVSLFYNLKMGGSVGIKNQDVGLNQSKGGLIVYPSLGLRFGQEKIKCTLDIGYKFQKANLTYVDSWKTSEQSVTYKRLVIRFGILI